MTTELQTRLAVVDGMEAAWLAPGGAQIQRMLARTAQMRVGKRPSNPIPVHIQSRSIALEESVAVAIRES